MHLFPCFLSAVFVVRNQSASIEKVLSDAAAVIADIVVDYELIVVDNASDDDSILVLKRLTAENGLANLQVYALTKEVDADTASWVGLENALGDFVVVVDPLADDISFVPKMLDQAVSGADVVFANNAQKPPQSLAYRGAYAVFHSLYNRFNGIHLAKEAGFTRVNVDLMHGLPEQTLEQALYDLKLAVENGATHVSWYQLTIELNTVFFRTQPVLPVDDVLEEIQAQGEAYLTAQGFVNYEVSAWRKEKPSAHNLNYWQFGDYLAIGAGAHGKVTQPDGVYRFQKTRLPKDYLAKVPAEHVQFKRIEADDMPFEFMMNALRLNQGVDAKLYAERTGLSLAGLDELLSSLRARKLMVDDQTRISCTEQGHVFLNSVLEEFL